MSDAQGAKQAAQGTKTDAERRADHAASDHHRADELQNRSTQRAEAATAGLEAARAQAAQAASVLASGTVAAADADETQAADADELAALNLERDGLQTDLTSVRIALATVAEKTLSFDRSLRNGVGERDVLAGQEERKVRQASDAADELAALTAQAEAREAEVVLARQAQDAASAALHAQAEARQTLLQESYDAGALLRALGEARASALEAIHKNEIKEAKLSVQRDTLAARLWDEYEISLGDVLALDDDPEVGEGTPSEVARLRRELRLIGDVNPAAIDEYEEVRTRHQFLLTQAADLEESRAKLLAAIGEIDEGTRGVFLETFHAVGAAFETIFTRLFGGGKTELTLDQPERHSGNRHRHSRSNPRQKTPAARASLRRRTRPDRRRPAVRLPLRQAQPLLRSGRSRRPARRRERRALRRPAARVRAEGPR